MCYVQSMATKTWPNRRAGTCVACGTKVAAEAGFVFRDEKQAWKCCCNSKVCGAHLGLVIEVPAAQRRELTVDGRVIMPYDPAALPLCRAFPGALFDREADPKCWHVSLAPADRARVLEIAEQLELKVAPELLVEDESVEELRNALVERGLYPFQVDGVCWLHQREHALLGDDMGLGKTVQVLCAFSEKARAIVICPASLKFNWRDECVRWRPDLKPVVLSGRGSFRHPEEGEVIITNYDILPKLPTCSCKTKGKLAWIDSSHTWICEKCTKVKGKTVHVDADPILNITGITLVADESTAVKNYKAIRSQVFKTLALSAAKVWELSGTPLLNRPFDLFGMLEAGGMAHAVFGGWKNFLRCFDGYKTRFGYEFGDPTPEAPERLRRVMLRRMKTEVLKDLPSITYKTVAVNALDKKLKADLDYAWGGWCEDTEADDSGPEDLPDFKEFSELRARLAASRIPAMDEIVEQYEDSEEPLVVFSAHRAPIDHLAKREGWAVITGDTGSEQRNETVKRFQAGELKGIALTIQAGGYGITLTHASHVLFVDLDWTPAANAQAEDRVRRIGQEASSILVTRMVGDHPLDRHIHALLSRKIRLIQMAVESRVDYKAPKAPKSASGSKWTEETAEEQEARKQAIHDAAVEAERDEAKARIQRIIGQESKRGGALPGAELKLTAEAKTALVEALSFMKSVCDGAQAKDGAGFSKPDVYRTEFLAEWMGLGEDEAFRASAMILCRYYKQLHEQFPTLFAKAA